MIKRKIKDNKPASGKVNEATACQPLNEPQDNQA